MAVHEKRKRDPRSSVRVQAQHYGLRSYGLSQARIRNRDRLRPHPSSDPTIRDAQRPAPPGVPGVRIINQASHPLRRTTAFSKIRLTALSSLGPKIRLGLLVGRQAKRAGGWRRTRSDPRARDGSAAAASACRIILYQPAVATLASRAGHEPKCYRPCSYAKPDAKK